MKILFINVVFGKGSTGKIIENLFSESSKRNETYLIYGRGKKIKKENVYKLTYEIESKLHHFISTITGNIYGGMFFSTNRIIRKIKKLNPDIVNLHCLNGYFVNIYRLLKWLAKNKKITVLTAHADFMMTGGCGVAGKCKKYLNCDCKCCPNVKAFNGRLSLNRTHHFYKRMANTIKLFDKNNLHVTTVSNWLKGRYTESPIYKGVSVDTAANPVDDVFFKKSLENPYKFDKNILFVTPDIDDPTKGSVFIDQIAKRRKDIHFTVICAKDMKHHFYEPNITYISGGVSKNKLRDYYYFADGTLLLSSFETFSMVTAESLACGTPVYGFKCGGPESITNPNDAIFVDYGDIEKLSLLLLTISNNKSTIAKNSYQSFNAISVFSRYESLFNSYLLLSHLM